MRVLPPPPQPWCGFDAKALTKCPASLPVSLPAPVPFPSHLWGGPVLLLLHSGGGPLAAVTTCSAEVTKSPTLPPLFLTPLKRPVKTVPVGTFKKPKKCINKLALSFPTGHFCIPSWCTSILGGSPDRASPQGPQEGPMLSVPLQPPLRRALTPPGAGRLDAAQALGKPRCGSALPPGAPAPGEALGLCWWLSREMWELAGSGSCGGNSSP